MVCCLEETSFPLLSCVEFVLPLFSPPLLLQLPIPSGLTGHVEETRSKRTAQLSWSPAKWRRTVDAGTCKDCVHLVIHYPKLLAFVFNFYNYTAAASLAAPTTAHITYLSLVVQPHLCRWFRNMPRNFSKK